MDEGPVNGELTGTAAAVLARYDCVLADLEALDLVAMSSVELTRLAREVEVRSRQQPVIGHRLIAELDDRAVAAEFGVRDTRALLRLLLRISAAEARRRTIAAANLGCRRTLTGERLTPLFGAVAAAQAEGAISIEHAYLITSTIDDLPHAIEAEQGEHLQEFLVDQARVLDPVQLNQVALRLRDVLDPDGVLADYRDLDRRRGATLVCRRDGSYLLSAVMTPECGAQWQVALDSLARPRPEADGLRDTRSPAQRMHDALAEIPALLIRAEQLPACGGVIATVLVTMTADQLSSGTGFARVGHDDLIPVRRVAEWAGESQLLSVLLDPHGGVMDFGQARRLASPGQRYALYARDGGCTVPGCDQPAAWCQVHHFDEFADGGSTAVANMGLVCGHHHRELARQGWRGVMIDGRPHWIPPAFIDPEQKPRRNSRFDLLEQPCP